MEKLTTQAQWDAKIMGRFEIHFVNRKTKEMEVFEVNEGSHYLSERPNITLQNIVTINLRRLNGWRPNLWRVQGIYKVGNDPILEKQ